MPFISASAITPYNAIRGGAGGLVALFLDTYPNASGAYSLRRLRTAYTGSAITVRRADFAEQDIGFVNNELDTTSLLSFVGSGDGFVVKWYDQSGNVKDFSISSANLQPSIVNSGSVILSNAKPAVEFNGTSNYLASPSLNLGNKTTYFNVYRGLTNGTEVPFDGDTSVNRQLPMFLNDNKFFINGGQGGSFQSAQASNLNQNLQVTSFDTLDNAFTNGVQQINNINTGTDTVTGALMGNVFNLSLPAHIKMQELVIYDSNKLSDRTEIEANINKFYSIYGTLLLDLYPDSAAAYSLRRLRTQYSGSAIRVRRADNTEQDIGFVNNQLDTVSLLAFVGSGDGFVAKWYDQSTGNDMGDGIQTTATLQPKIVDSGSVTLFNGLPVIKFDDSGMEFENLMPNSTVRTIFTTFNTSGTAEQQIFINSSVDGKRMQCSLYRSGAGKLGVLSTLRSPANGNTGGSITAGQSLITAIQKSDALSSFIDSSQVSDNNASRGGASLNRLGYLTGNNNPLIGGISEYIIYNADKSTDRAAIETNINNYYSIYGDNFMLKEDGDELLLESGNKIIL